MNGNQEKNIQSNAQNVSGMTGRKNDIKTKNIYENDDFRN